MKRLIGVVLLGLTLLFSVSVSAGSQWLVGTWELAHDPDGNEKDWVEFSLQGQVISYGQDKTRQVQGEYTVDGNEVRIVYRLYGKEIPMVLKAADNKSSLLVYSARTGNTATYIKLP